MKIFSIKAFIVILVSFFLYGCVSSEQKIKHDHSEEPELFSAISDGNTEKAKKLIEDIKFNDDRVINDALVTAAYFGDVEIVNLAISKGADVNYFGGGNPLYAATLGGHMDIVKILLSKNAKLLTDRHGLTPLMLAASKGNNELIDLFISLGANVNAAQPNGWSAIVHAIEKNRVSTVKHLLEKGANLDGMATLEEGGEPKSVLEIAKHYGNQEIINTIMNNTNF